MDHRKDSGKERGLSEYSFDYAFPGDEYGCKMVTLVGRERATGTVMATAVPTKGTTGRFEVDKMEEMIEEVGDTNVAMIVKTDQENAVRHVINKLVEAREDGRTIVEESPVQSSGSNGGVERCVQGVEGQMRVMLIALEERIGKVLSPNEPVVQFIPEYAAYLMNRLEVGADGKTAYERAKGKRATVLGLEFAEKVLWEKKEGRQDGKVKE